MNRGFRDGMKKRSFYVAILTIICAAGVVSYAEKSAKNPDDVSQIKLAQEGNRDKNTSKDGLTTQDENSGEGSTLTKDENVGENNATWQDETLNGTDTLTQDEISQNNTSDLTMDENAGEQSTLSQDETLNGESVNTEDEELSVGNEVVENDVSDDETSYVISDGALSFNQEKGLSWPVSGEIIMKYSQDKPVYYHTTGTFRTNDGLLIAANEGDFVKSACEGQVKNVYSSDEYGKMIDISIGDNYTVTYGQLDMINVSVGDKVAAGQDIAKVGSPTAYYTKEGAHLYMKVSENSESVDPLLFLE